MSTSLDLKQQRFNRTNISMHDFEHALDFIDAVSKYTNIDLEYEALLISAIVT